MLNDLLHDAPNPQTSSYLFRQSLWLNVLVSGGGFAEIVRNAVGQPVELWNLLPERVVPFRERGELLYRVDGHIVVPASNMLHIRGTSATGVVGMDTSRLRAKCLVWRLRRRCTALGTLQTIRSWAAS